MHSGAVSLSPEMTAFGSVGKKANFSLGVKVFSTSAGEQNSLTFSIFTPLCRPLVTRHKAARGAQ